MKAKRKIMGEYLNIKIWKWVGRISLIGIFAGFMTLPLMGQVQQESNEQVVSAEYLKKLSEQEVKKGSQNSVLLQKEISLKLRQNSLLEALKKVASKGELTLSYDTQLSVLENKITLDLKQITIEDALWRILENTGLRFVVTSDDQLILVRQYEENPVKLAQETISGTVTDAQTGEALPGVNIIVKGTTTGTSTDANGEFELTVESLQDTLVVSFVGYQTQETPINGRTTIDIGLQAQAISGEEMVVVGYGEQEKRKVTGSISEVSSESFEGRAVNSSTQALQGLAPNLNVSAANSGGAADASVNINIRGTGSLSSSAPLILIDGVRSTNQQFSELDPNVIEDISVLKDAASSAIYGAQAAYGVILVETKGGHKNQDFQFNYSNNFRFKKRIFVPSSVNTIKYAEVLNEASQNYSGQTAIDEEQLEKIRAFNEGKLEYGTAPNPDNSSQWLGIESGTSDGWYSGFANSDWWDIMYDDIGFAQQHNLSFSGGNEDITYRMSGAYFNDSGQLTYGAENEDFSRYNLRSKVSADITDWLNISNTSSYKQVNKIFPGTLEGSSRGRLYHDIMRFSPLAPYKTPPMENESGDEIVPEQLALLPAFNENNGYNKNIYNDFRTTLNTVLKITSFLELRGDFTFKRRFRHRTLNHKKWTLLGPDGSPSITYQKNNNKIEKDIRKTDYISFNIYAEYDRSFRGKHNLDLLLGFQQEENNYSRMFVTRQDVIANDLNSQNVAVGEILGPSNPMSTWANRGGFGRLSYDFKDKYLFEFSGRYDGSSKFAPGHRFVFSPSFSVGYNLDEEKFWEPLQEYINNMKVRASWGSLGNQNVGSYLYLTSLPITNRMSWIIDDDRPNSTGAPGIISPNITWETSITKNIGVDLAFLDNRLSATLDVFERQTKDMFGPSGSLPNVLGTSPPQTNSANLKTTGWELSVNWADNINDFSYNLKLMLSDNKTTITKYHNPDNVISDYYEGQQLGEIWGFEADELFQSEQEVNDYISETDLSYFGTNWQPGNVKYKDLDGDGKVNVGDNTLEDPGDRKIIGNNSPRYRISLQGRASWKNFDFSMLWQGVGKRDYWIHRYGTLFWGWNSRGHSRITEAVLDHWSEDNPDGYLPIQLENGGGSGFGKDRYPSTRYLQDASYVRLKNISIGYNIPSYLTQKIDIQNLRVYVNGENLLTFTPMWENFDPELITTGSHARTDVGRAYPLARVYGFGIEIEF